MTARAKPRLLNEGELRLVRALLERAGAQYRALAQDLERAQVVTLPDGGMGSLEFVYEAGKAPAGEYGIATLTFEDGRGMGVSAALHTNVRGELFELDMFTGDSLPLAGIPLTFQ